VQMTKNSDSLPVISHEVAFIALHEKEPTTVLQSKNFKPEWLKNLSDRVYARANADVLVLIRELQKEINRNASNVRITWKRLKLDEWENSGEVHSSQRGHPKLLGFDLLDC
jgi:hypothetical protein